MFVGLLGKRVGKQWVIIKIVAAKPSPLHLRYCGTPFILRELFLRLTTLASHLIRNLSPVTLVAKSTTEVKVESHAPGNLRSELVPRG